MLKRIIVLTCLLILMVILGACGAKPTPDPTEVARLAAEAVKATLTAQVPESTTTPIPPTKNTPTATSTATVPPTPMPTDTPTPEPTATPTASPKLVSIPTGWKPYQLISGEVMVAYPPNWKITSEGEKIVMWDIGGNSFAAVADVTDKVSLSVTTDSATQARELKKQFLEMQGNDSGVSTTFPEEGTLDLSAQPVYVLSKQKKQGVELAAPMTFVSNGDRVVFVLAEYIPDSTMPIDALETLSQLAGSVQFKPFTISTPIPTATPDMSTVEVAKAANLRAGPGTNYQVVGKAKVGDKLSLLGKSEDGKWFVVDLEGKEGWIADFLVEKIDGAALPIRVSTAPTLTPTVAPTQAPAPTAAPQQAVVAPPQPTKSSRTQIGQDVEGAGWRFKVSEVHKRKAVYFYDNSYIAQGHFLVVIIDATNLQSGTDYFWRNIVPWVTDRAANEYLPSAKGSSYAEWQYGGLSSAFEDVNPGNSIRLALAFDLPDNVGDIQLSTEILQWIDLGDFNQLASEDVP